MNAVTDSGHAHDEHGPYGGVMRWVTTTTTRTSARFTCGSVSPCSWSAACSPSPSAPSCSSRACSSGIRSSSTSSPRCTGSSWCSARSCRPSSGSPTGSAADDRRSRHGFCAPEQLELLDASRGGDPARRIVLRARGATAAGWTIYAPLSTQMGPGMDLAIFALHIMGASSIMGSINIITTILNMRAPGMTLFRMPLSFDLAHHRVPPYRGDAGARRRHHDVVDRPPFRHVLLQRGGRRRPVMFQHIFWFFGHPEVYIMILPGFASSAR